MNLEHLLTEDQLQLRQTLRDFTKKEIMPITKQLEADYSLVEKVHQKLVDMGIQSSHYPVEYGGGGIHSGNAFSQMPTIPIGAPGTVSPSPMRPTLPSRA